MAIFVAAFETRLLVLIGLVITNSSINRGMTNEIHTAQAVLDTKIEVLTREVRVHSWFTEHMQ